MARSHSVQRSATRRSLLIGALDGAISWSASCYAGRNGIVMITA
jgi:hypothetical protein